MSGFGYLLSPGCSSIYCLPWGQSRSTPRFLSIYTHMHAWNIYTHNTRIDTIQSGLMNRWREREEGTLVQGFFPNRLMMALGCGADGVHFGLSG